MARHARLARQGDAISDQGSAGDAGERHNEAVLADDDVVRDLHQVVDLSAPLDHRRTAHAPIDGDVGADLHIVFDDHRADVRHFMLLAAHRHVAETVGADDRSRVDDHVLADGHPVHHRYVGIENTPVADPAIGAHDDPGAQDDAVSDDGAGTDDHVGLDRHVFADLGVGRDDRGLMNARGKMRGRLKRLQDFRPRKSRIVDADRRPLKIRSIRTDDDAGGLRRAGRLQVTPFRQKSDFLWPRFVDGRGAGDFQMGRTLQLSADKACDLVEAQHP